MCDALRAAPLAASGPVSLAPPPANDAPAADAPVLERPTLGQILRRYGDAFRARHHGHLTPEQYEVMNALERCRTGELGATLYRCQNCGAYHVVAQSCGNRHCPRCQGHQGKRWFERQRDKLLPCPYFLVTFTLPHELRAFVQTHPSDCYRALFTASAETLRELAGNPKYVGSRRLGFTGVLHTWGRQLVFHPHVHFLVPGGGLSDDGQRWRPSRVEFFVPVKAASPIFRAKFLALRDEAGLGDEARRLAGEKKGIVHSQAVGDGRQALQYLAPDVFRVALSNRRIVHCEPGPDGLGRVTFTYRQKGSRRERSLTLTADEFLRRFLQHVLPRGFQKVRHYGFAHPGSRVDPAWLKMLVTVTLNPVYELLVAAPPLPVPHRPKCPECGGQLACVGFILPRDWPYASYDTS